MSKLYFKYGAMGCSKSAQALMCKFNYEQKGFNVLLLKPSIDTRDYDNGKAVVRSRIGIKSECRVIGKEDNLLELYKKLCENEAATFDTLTDKNGFVGEIYLRLICEDSPYYYIGLIEKNGKIRAYLLDAESGKVLAKRES